MSGAGGREGSALEVLRVSLALGLTSFGGPVAHLGYFRREYVERRRWLDDTAYADLVALCQALPGPASSQLGIAIGTGRAGIRGGIAAWLGFTLPSALALLLLGLFAASTDLSGAGWVHGLKLAAVAVVAQAVVGMARTLTPDVPRRLVALAATAVSVAFVTPLSQVAVIAGGALAGLVLARAGWIVAGGGPGAGSSVVPAASRIPARAGIAALAAFGVLLLALPVVRDAGGQPIALFDAFYRAGSLVFGGGHVVLPLLQANTVAPGWVTEDAFLAGYGAAQAVPGPLFTFSAFLGAVAVVPPNGVAGATIALVAIFLPSFLLVFGALPFWDRLRVSPVVRRGLAGANAAVVGLLAAALYRPVATSAIEGVPDLALALAGFAALVSGRVPVVAVVGGLALAGELVGRLGG